MYLIYSEHVAIKYHKRLIEETGGSSGLRDRESLMSALSRPMATFAGTELFPTPERKAAAILEAIVINHPFIDGNKRTGFALAEYHLNQNSKAIGLSDEACEVFVLEVASGIHNTESIIEWIESNVIPFKHKG